MKKIYEAFKWFFTRWMLVLVVLIILAVIATLILKYTTSVEEPYKIPLFVVGGWGVFCCIYVFLRQIYWAITRTGDYEKKKK
jgi:amino acid transporter